MQGLFWNPHEQRLRALWRILIMVSLYVLIVRGTRWLFLATGSGTTLSNTTSLELLRLIVLLILLALMARTVDKRRFSDYGLHLKSGRWWVDLGFGFVLTAVLISLLFWLQTNLGWITISSSLFNQGLRAAGGTLVFPLVSTIATAFYIELFFRGYLITNLGEGFTFLGRLYQPRPAIESGNTIQRLLNNVWQRTPVLAAWLMATMFFLVVRVDVDMATNVLVLNLLRASFLLTLPFILTRSLAIPIGLNLGWNIATQNVYGLKVVGGGLLGSEVAGVTTSARALLVVVQGGPTMLTGGPLGPEGGLLGMAVVILAGMMVMLWLRLRHGADESAPNPWAFPYRPA